MAITSTITINYLLMKYVCQPDAIEGRRGCSYLYITPFLDIAFGHGPTDWNGLDSAGMECSGVEEELNDGCSPIENEKCCIGF